MRCSWTHLLVMSTLVWGHGTKKYKTSRTDLENAVTGMPVLPIYRHCMHLNWET